MTELEIRIAVCRRLADEGKCLSDAARQFDMSVAGMHQYLDRNGHVALRKRLTAKSVLSPAQASARLSAISRKGSVAEAARELGLPYSTLYRWYRRQGPSHV